MILFVKGVKNSKVWRNLTQPGNNSVHKSGCPDELLCAEEAISNFLNFLCTMQTTGSSRFCIDRPHAPGIKDLENLDDSKGGPSKRPWQTWKEIIFKYWWLLIWWKDYTNNENLESPLAIHFFCATHFQDPPTHNVSHQSYQWCYMMIQGAFFFTVPPKKRLSIKKS